MTYWVSEVYGEGPFYMDLIRGVDFRGIVLTKTACHDDGELIRQYSTLCNADITPDLIAVMLNCITVV
ncbi:hypothetical protein RIR_jg8759.t1 [Rhizophagus irregularis DAOM 181602=DAOM 197198]|nr:hypothetical protein RIR_jg8759.t1 [Rhizophagus irregularis DAOM 181602=DAOM 197198]